MLGSTPTDDIYSIRKDGVHNVATPTITKPAIAGKLKIKYYAPVA